MKLAVGLFAAVVALAGGASAQAPGTAPAVDYTAALMQPCADASDETPWLVVVNWDDGDVYYQLTRFDAAGVLAYQYADDDFGGFDSERWAITGATLTFDMNDHFADYTGTFDGVGATGTVKNIQNDTGKWTMTRDCNG